MNRHKSNNMVLLFEITFFMLCAITFGILGFGNLVTESVANIIYCSFIVISFGYLFILGFFLKKYDIAVHYKAFSKHYVPTGKVKEDGYKRKGLMFMVLLWVAYLALVALLKACGVLKWHVFLIGACIMFGFNSLFIRKVRLLSVWFFHNKDNCCKNCGINSWDYAIFASALLFAPKMSIVATAINIVVIILSFVILVVWEVNYHKHPYRFYPETNKTLGCANCTKQCKACK